MKDKAMTARVVRATHAKNNFGEVIRRVYEDEETQIIERGGLPVAAIVSISDLERLYPNGMKSIPGAVSNAKREKAWRRFNTLLDTMQAGNEQFSEEEVEADVLRAVEEVRAAQRAADAAAPAARRPRVARGPGRK